MLTQPLTPCFGDTPLIMPKGMPKSTLKAVSQPQTNGLQTHQATIKAPIPLQGKAVHSGKETALTLLPQGNDAGIRFICANRQIAVQACHESAVETNLQTTLCAGDMRVSTIEHLFAALHAVGIDNLDIRIDGEEMPIFDGSARTFTDLLLKQKTTRPDANPRKYLKILRTVRTPSQADGAYAEFSPYPRAHYDFEIDFPEPNIGRQRYSTRLDAASFRREVAPARTFGFRDDLECYHAQGLGLGAGYENTIVLESKTGAVLNREGLRFKNELVRHKLLDAVGDTFLAGYPILGAYKGYKSGHALNLRLLRCLLADESAYRIVGLSELDSSVAA